MSGEVFIDRLGGWTQVLLAGASLGIVLSRFSHGASTANAVLAGLFALEIFGAVAITLSRLGPMRVAFAIYGFRVLSALAYMSVVHGDKLARSTLGFTLVVFAYAWMRVRALSAANSRG